MSQQNRILKHCQRIAQTLNLTENTKGDVHKAGALLLDIMKDLDTLREIRQAQTENPNNADLGKAVRILLSK
tara:strand:- start:289 stop:504 length:216 start_codon:yes stop_codon:yes gene_type:complete